MITASQRLEQLWASIESSAYSPTDLPDLGLPSIKDAVSGALHILIPERLRRTLDSTDNIITDRPKVIHTYGTVARVTLSIGRDSPFTGVLASGTSTTGLVRLSLATPPGRRKSFIPGMGLKLFVDDKSLDLAAVNHTNGQGRDPNFFANELTHDLTGKHTESRRPQRMMAALFGRVSREPRRLSIDHLTSTGHDGSHIGLSRTPLRLDFVPHADTARTFQGRAGEDFRRVLARIEPNTGLYDVCAVTTPGSEVIGELRLTSQFVASAPGDNLFFRHHQDETAIIRPTT